MPLPGLLKLPKNIDDFVDRPRRSLSPGLVNISSPLPARAITLLPRIESDLRMPCNINADRSSSQQPLMAGFYRSGSVLLQEDALLNGCPDRLMSQSDNRAQHMTRRLLSNTSSPHSAHLPGVAQSPLASSRRTSKHISASKTGRDAAKADLRPINILLSPQNSYQQDEPALVIEEALSSTHEASESKSSEDSPAARNLSRRISEAYNI